MKLRNLLNAIFANFPVHLPSKMVNQLAVELFSKGKKQAEAGKLVKAFL